MVMVRFMPAAAAGPADPAMVNAAARGSKIAADLASMPRPNITHLTDDPDFAGSLAPSRETLRADSFSVNDGTRRVAGRSRDAGRAEAGAAACCVKRHCIWPTSEKVAA
jgi:hypothetical protein